MYNKGQLYCRLCANQIPFDKLISPEDEIAVNSKLATKMLTIDVDINEPNLLPKTVCFTCFDQLEKTFIFINDVKSSQKKLLEIFLVKQPVENGLSIVTDSTKTEVKEENCINLFDTDIKIEESDVMIANSDQLYETMLNLDYNSTDSDVPLVLAIKGKKMKKKRKTCKLGPLESISGLSLMNYISWEGFMYRCGLCDALCKNASSLRLHSFEIHKSCCIFRCVDCTKVLANHLIFVNHMRKHHESLKFSCEYCNKQFSSTIHARKHRREKHNGPKCLICGLIFDSDELLSDHISSYSKGYKRLHRSKLKSNLTCQICNKKFKTKSSFSQHKLLHTQRTRDYTCHICGKMFYTKGTLSTHILVHEDEKRYKCDYCPLVFRARGNLQNHISLHSGVKPFVCEQCGKSFRVKRQLKSHSIVHTDLMPYVCQFCQKSFRFKTRLNLHLRQHTGAKPYKCVYCQRDFTNGSNYKKHMKRRHNIDTSVRKKYEVNSLDVEFEKKINVDDINSSEMLENKTVA